MSGRCSVLVAASSALLLGGCRDEPRPPISRAKPHVLLLHLDGYRPDLTRTLLQEGRLPYLGYLASRGRISFETTTVDKSETMKVIQSYLTSEIDTTVVGWWQFDRSDFRFRNYWLDPAEVLNYALGLTFPRSPTIQDFLAARGENLVSGMSLARRGVPFENYGRAYLEGIDAVSNHTYHRQADATMTEFLQIHRRIVENDEPSPALSTLLLAAADEFAHAEGATTTSGEGEHCFERADEADETVFRLLDEDASRPAGGALAGLESRYFTRVKRSLLGKAEEVCIELPLLESDDGSPPRRAHPHYVLSMLVLDIELGYLVETFRSIRFDPQGHRTIERPPSIWESGEEPTNSLFASTLFLLFGDHGMVDTPGTMTGSDSFLDQLNRRLALDTAADAPTLREGEEIGVDYEHLPIRLKSPEIYPQWQSEDVRRMTDGASLWAQSFLKDLRGLVREDLHESYWWLFFLRSLLIDPKLDEEIGPVSGAAVALLRSLYLRGLPEYRAREAEANREFFDDHVRLVYGGGARNNAEIFLPVCEGDGTCSWGRRPTYDEIMSSRGGSKSGRTVVNALRDIEGVGLLFIRKNNEEFRDGGPLPEKMEIDVQDRAGNRGSIAVFRDRDTRELVFWYRTDPSSKRDPLGYERWGSAGAFGTYDEWNERTLGLGYVNVVGGIGTYLYSTNPAIGDILVTHQTGWNFGENLGGHGGVHRFEKTTFLLASGPRVSPGKLLARQRYDTADGGALVADGASTRSPTLLDLVPTALVWLGHDPGELERFAVDGYPAYLEAWIRSQRGDILSHLDGMSSIEQVKEQARVQDLSLAPLRPEIERLLQFVETDRGATLEKLEPRRLLGSPLELQ